MKLNAYNPEISYAKKDDIKFIVRICRSSFPNSIRWNGFRFWATNWWQNVLSSKMAETIVVRDAKGISAFVLLIIDEISFINDMVKHPVPFYKKILSAVSCPNLVILHIIKKINRNVNAVIELPEHNNSNVENRTWIELIATNPDCRGKGLAKKLLEFCETETKKNQRRYISLRVDIKNNSAQQLYEKAGYKRTSINEESYNYLKEVNC